MGRGQYRDRRTYRPRFDPAAESRPGARDRRVPAEQDCLVKIISSNNRAELRRLLAPRARADRKIEHRVRTIVDRVRTGGDRALAKFAKEFDGVSGPIEISHEEMRDGAASVNPAVRRALRQAAQNLRRVASRQLPKSW